MDDIQCRRVVQTHYFLAEFFDMAIWLGILGLRERIGDIKNATYVQEELERDFLGVVGSEFGQRDVGKAPVGEKNATHFTRGDDL